MIVTFEKDRRTLVGIPLPSRGGGPAAFYARDIDYLQSLGVLSTVKVSLMGKPQDLVQGTLDLLILKVLSLEPRHGWAIAKRIQHISKEQLQIQQGSLYPALYRLERQGWIRGAWRETELGREAKFYALTAAGRKQLEAELATWARLSNAINLVTSTS